MESSQLDEKETSTAKGIQNEVVEQTVIDITECGSERVENCFMTTDQNDLNEPCCSWREPPPKTELCRSKTLLGNVINSLMSTTAVSTMQASTSNSADQVQQCRGQTHIENKMEIIPLQNVQNPEMSSRSIIMPDLFHDLETLEHFQNTSYDTAPTYSEVPPPSASRTVRVVNIPDSSMMPMLQRREPVIGPPPSYSKSLLDRRVNPCASIQFVAPIPPPSYDGMDNELRYAGHSGFTLGLGNTWQSQPQPAYCPVCETVTITRTDMRASRTAHIFATILFFLLCLLLSACLDQENAAFDTPTRFNRPIWYFQVKMYEFDL